MTKKDLLRTLLKGIETGDAAAAAVVNEARYVQHNPQTHQGSEGLAVLFARLAKTNPRVTFVRVFEDGDFAFAHNQYDFCSERVAFEVFRFENHKAVEHWDNIQPKHGPNPSGRHMLDGTTAITDLERTEPNRKTVCSFVQEVLIGRRFTEMQTYVDNALIQHNPNIKDGCQAYLAALTETATDAPRVRYDTLHRVLAEGNFVLCMSEGQYDGAHTSFYDLFRVSRGRIVEHWDTIETIAPRSEWKNDNGKF